MALFLRLIEFLHFSVDFSLYDQVSPPSAEVEHGLADHLGQTVQADAFSAVIFHLSRYIVFFKFRPVIAGIRVADQLKGSDQEDEQQQYSKKPRERGTKQLHHFGAFRMNFPLLFPVLFIY